MLRSQAAIDPAPTITSAIFEPRRIYGSPALRAAAAIGAATTLPEALRSISGAEGGFRFVDSARKQRYLTFPEIYGEAVARASRLQARGFRQGDRIALAVSDEAEVALSFLAITMAGLVPVLIGPRNLKRIGDPGADTLSHILRNSGARLLIVGDALRALASASIGPGGPEVVSPEDVFGEADPQVTAASYSPPDIPTDAPCLLQYTSGSTGSPKGTIITHRNLLANVEACLAAGMSDGSKNDKVVSWLPLYHDFGLFGFFLAPLLARLPTVILSAGLFARRPKVWLDTLHDEKATITGAPNFAFAFLLRRLKPADLTDIDLSALSVLFCGGELIQRDAFIAFADRLAPTGFDAKCFMPSYGLAESTVAVSLHPHGRALVSDTVASEPLRNGTAVATSDSGKARVLVSCGFPIPGHEVEIVDEGARLLPERQVGEIRVRGPSVSPGYFGDSEATSESWHDGWLHTGDLGYFAEGELYVCGRIKDLIVIRGVNYHPPEIEWAVERSLNTRVRGVAAFATHVDGADSFAIVIEAAVGSPEQRQALVANVQESVTQEHGITPADVRIVPLGTIPVTTSGKVQRRRLRGMYEAGDLSEEALRRDPRPVPA